MEKNLMVIVVFIRWEGRDKLVYGEETFGEQNVMDIVVFIRWEGKDKLVYGEETFGEQNFMVIVIFIWWHLVCSGQWRIRRSR